MMLRRAISIFLKNTVKLLLAFHMICASGRKIHTLKIKDAVSPFQLGILDHHRMALIGRHLKYDLVPNPLPQGSI